MADTPRAGDNATRKHFRADRFSVSNGKYYFSTREGTLEGPFSDRDEAERELALYIRRASGKDIYGSIIAEKKPGG